MLQISSECAAPVSGALEEDRIILMENEVYRLPQTHQEIQVLSGIAWITLDQQDIILHSHEKASLAPSKNFAVISALNNMPLILTLRQDKNPVRT
ncbi:hypothetical protein [Microcoleus vaginatus]|uniref:hypothetical protein n=1 Tax=Microcoleus vaginatus TaxID=119532 RepID=UPI00168777F3|nr:hypothetical protein [Microcoleus sp. FACHB-DQ6]MBD1887241.1 hypothetical protein [Microcoleus sp. FACHB-84]MBD2007936.1 hypothetical protein [Microcoleus sp. FACHB-45]